MAHLNPQDISALIARAEEATGPDREIDAAIAEAAGGCAHRQTRRETCDVDGSDLVCAACGSDDLYHPPVTASLDAALALAERALPGGWIDLSGPRKYLNIPTPVPNYWRAECGDAIGWGATPALAILKALLKALHSQTEGGDDAAK